MESVEVIERSGQITNFQIVSAKKTKLAEYFDHLSGNFFVWIIHPGIYKISTEAASDSRIWLNKILEVVTKLWGENKKKYIGA